MAQEFSYEAVLAIGVVFVLLLGEIDLSLGYLTLLSVALTASFSALNGMIRRRCRCLQPSSSVRCAACSRDADCLGSHAVFRGDTRGFLIFEGIAYHILAGSTINVFDPVHRFASAPTTYRIP